MHQEKRGSTVILRFAGPESIEKLREIRQPVGLLLRDLPAVDGDWVRTLVEEAAKRKAPTALIDPPPAVVEILALLGVEMSVLSAEGALVGSLEESLEKDQAALAELGARFHANPLWRRVDQESMWLCPFCGSVGDVKLSGGAKPEPAVLRAVRGHLLDRCRAWRSGRRTPLPASMLDSFLVEINKRKISADTERRRAMSEQIESLQDLERSVSQAQRRQLHLLPIEPEPEAVAEIAVHYRPLQTVSGDFLDFYPLPEDRFGVTIGDVSGHGVEAAIIMGMAKMALRLATQNSATVQEMATTANRNLYAELRRAVFVTAFVGVIDRATRRMSYVRAGHPPPLVRRASGAVEALDARGLPLGADAGTRFAAGLEARAADLSPGDLVVLYTDGVIEAGTPEPFGVERLRAALATAPSDSADACLRHVVGMMDGFLSGASPGDDVTMIVLKIR